MPITRRTFLAGGLTLSTLPRNLFAAPLQTGKLTPFVDPLPPLATVGSVERRRSLPFYRVTMGEFQSKVHRDLPPTRQWGYNNSSPGPAFETRSGEPLLVEWVNQLPARHFLRVDHNIMGAEKENPEVRAVVHVHGARCPPESDGYPENWNVPGKSEIYHFPNRQDAAMLWYHDHAMGITRLNTFAGLFGLFIVRDEIEDALNLPRGKYELPLVICDRSFRTDGQLNYPVSPIPDAPWVDECVGEFTLINGKLFPYLDVEPRKYRVRILNASNSRFYNLAFSNNLAFHQIGSDQGLLSAPISLANLMIAPGERADLIIDFAANRSQQIILRNGFVNLMQFRVADSKVDDASALPHTLRPVARTPESSAVKTRVLSLGEHHDHLGNATRMLLNGMPWHMPVTENPVLDSTEIWNLVNVTDDSHPIHLHLVRFQILDRRRFDVALYETNRQIRYLSPPEPPEPGEEGWKDTVRAHSRMVTRIIIHFEGFPGRYVWHCHNLEHEDNEMMRPYDVLPLPS